MTAPVAGIVQESGGGVFTVLVDRDTPNYPVPGERVIAMFQPAPKHEATQMFRTYSGSGTHYTIICDCGDKFTGRSDVSNQAVNLFRAHVLERQAK